MEMKQELENALAAIEADPDELAYLALTSKPEFQIRDRLAYRLHHQLDEMNRRVAREWHRVDLALLDQEKPLVLL
jgi:hypothetical protein